MGKSKRSPIQKSSSYWKTCKLSSRPITQTSTKQPSPAVSTGATSVYIFSHITRRDDSAKIQAALATDPKLSSASTPVPGIFPARYIHIDQTPACALQVLQDHFDASSPVGRHALEKNGRWGIINGWRPSRVSSIR